MSEIKMYLPDASLRAVAVCDGLLAVTVASATGWPDCEPTTAPLKLPVVPAMTGAALFARNRNAKTAEAMMRPVRTVFITSSGERAFAVSISAGLKRRYPGVPLYGRIVH